ALARVATTAASRRLLPAPAAASAVAPASRSPRNLASSTCASFAAPHKKASACTPRLATASTPDSLRSLPASDSTAPSETPLPARIAAPPAAPLRPLRSIAAAPLTRQPGLFFRPVHFHLQLPDLLVQLRLQLLVGFGGPLRALGENLRCALQQLL